MIDLSFLYRIFPSLKTTADKHRADTERFKAINEEVWRISEEYKSRDKDRIIEIASYKERIEEYEDMKGKYMSIERQEELITDSQDEYKEVIRLLIENKDLNETILFLKIMLKLCEDKMVK